MEAASIISWLCRQEEGWSLEKKVWCDPQRWQVSRDTDLKNVVSRTLLMVWSRYMIREIDTFVLFGGSRWATLLEQNLAEQLAPVRPIWPRCWTSDGHHDLFDCEDGLKNAERSWGESVESECIQHRSQLDLKHFQDRHQYVDSLSYNLWKSDSFRNMAGPRTSKTGAPQHVFRTCRCPYVILCHLMSSYVILCPCPISVYPLQLFTTLYIFQFSPILPVISKVLPKQTFGMRSSLRLW